MNVVDSSGWLEYFADGPNAEFFKPAIENITELVMPSINIYEVFKKVLQQRDESNALQAITAMLQGTVVDLDSKIALNAAKLSLELELPMADSVMLATAQAYNSKLWTQDADFKGIKNVQYIEKQ